MNEAGESYEENEQLLFEDRERIMYIRGSHGQQPAGYVGWMSADEVRAVAGNE